MKKSKIFIIISVVLVTLILISSTLGFFSDRINQSAKFVTSTFTKDGYEISRVAPSTPFVAGEDIEVTIKESNGKAEDIISEISMSVSWSSPDSSKKIFGNANPSDNAIISIGNTVLDYELKADGSAHFTLPEHMLTEGASNVQRLLSFHIPESLTTTGVLEFNFNGIRISQANGGFSTDYSSEDLNAEEDLDFSCKIGWDLSKTPGSKAVMGYLNTTNTSGQYTMSVDGSGAMYDWSGVSASPQSNYKSSIVGLNISSSVSSIGNYAFADFAKLSSVTIPSGISSIGNFAFYNISIPALNIPSNVLSFGSMSFGYIEQLTEITFNHNKGSNISFPTAGEVSGAFYVPVFVETTINTANTKALEYDWVTDNRMEDPVPVLAAQNTWYTGSTGKGTITEVKLVDSYIPTGRETESWPAAVDEDGDGILDDDIMCYVNGTVLTIAGNGSGRIMANEDSSRAFKSFSAMTTFSNAALLDTSNVLYMGDPVYMAYGMFTGCESLKTLDLSSWNTEKVRSMMSMFSMCQSLESINLGNWETGQVTTIAHMFSNCNVIKTIDVSDWDTSKVRGMNDVFNQCYALETLDVSNWDTSSATMMLQLFRLCESLTGLDVSKWNTSNVVNMKGMFEGTKLITTLDVSSKVLTDSSGVPYATWDTGKVTDMSSMFGGCEALASLDVSKFNTSRVTTMSQMFNNCQSLPAVDVTKESVTVNGKSYTTWDTSLVEDMGWMFRGCKSMSEIDVSDFNTANVVEMDDMFMFCSGITTVPVSEWDISSATDISGMFDFCTKLTNLDLSKWDTSNVVRIGDIRNFTGMFQGCTSLVDLNVSGWDTSKATDMNYVFCGCSALGSLDLSGWSTEKVTGMSHIFDDMVMLDNVTLDSGFAFLSNSSAYLPAPDAAYLSGVNGNWYNTTTWDGYTPEALATAHAAGAVKVTYTAYPPVPTLAKTEKWYTQGKTDIEKSSISTINIVNEYDVTDKSIIDQWDASTLWDGTATDEKGVVTAYIEDDGNGGYKLTIAGNGSGKIFAHADSTDAFYNFKNVTSITGLSLLDTRNVTIMDSMFHTCSSLRHIDFGTTWDTSNVKDMSYMFRNCSALESIDLSCFEVNNVEDMSYLFALCPELTDVVFGSSWDSSKVKTMKNMFWSCSGLPEIDFTYFDTDSVEDFAAMFSECSSLTSLDLTSFKTSCATAIGSMFESCSSLQSIIFGPNWDVSKVSEMNSLFQGCTSLPSIDLSRFNTSSALKNMDYMFKQCRALTSLDLSPLNISGVVDMTAVFTDCTGLQSIILGANWNTSNVEEMDYLFSGCRSLKSIDLSKFDTGNVEGMAAMFEDCDSLTSIDLSTWNTGKVIRMGQMFNTCDALQSIVFGPNFSTAAATDMVQMFRNCPALQTLNLVNFDTSGATATDKMFEGCITLAEVTLGPNFVFDTSDPSCFLPLPNNNYIADADGKWYNTATQAPYTIEELAAAHSGTATYTAHAIATTMLLSEDFLSEPSDSLLAGNPGNTGSEDFETPNEDTEAGGEGESPDSEDVPSEPEVEDSDASEPTPEPSPIPSPVPTPVPTPILTPMPEESLAA